jgi:hypothetical protein
MTEQERDKIIEDLIDFISDMKVEVTAARSKLRRLQYAFAEQKRNAKSEVERSII